MCQYFGHVKELHTHKLTNSRSMMMKLKLLPTFIFSDSVSEPLCVSNLLLFLNNSSIRSIKWNWLFLAKLVGAE